MPRREKRSREGIKFGDTIRRLRAERGYSQEVLAERAKLNADFLGFIERGDNLPTLATILQLARALGVKPSTMMKDFDE
ncbi:MAG TPA: helix-turn-helix transcriptional regulator [Thermoanaerobaculia bacterium]|nr:helix-turn-helix transcriptional regulator [Thermoanaerobaculia bacterium]